MLFVVFQVIQQELGSKLPEDIGSDEKQNDTDGEQGLTIVSVGHRPSLRQFHAQVLKLRSDGGYDISSA